MFAASTAANPVNPRRTVRSVNGRRAAVDAARCRDPMGTGCSRWTVPLPVRPINPAGHASRDGRLPEVEHLVAASAPGPPLPVIVWLHGGSFISASGGFAGQNGTRFVEEKDAIVVAPNYRLGPLGFLGHRELRNESANYPSAGNYGLLDQRLALEWVRTHIEPSAIQTASRLPERRPGDTASAFIWYLPAARGCSIAPSCRVDSPRIDGARGKTVRSRPTRLPLGWAAPTPRRCSPVCARRPSVRCSARCPWEPNSSPRVAHALEPVVDGLVIQDQPRTLYEIGAFSRVPTIIGSNRDRGWTFVNRSFPGEMTQEQYESALATEFGADAAAILAAPTAAHDSPKDALAQAVTDAEYACGAKRLSSLIERTNTPVYLYGSSTWSMLWLRDERFMDSTSTSCSGPTFAYHFLPTNHLHPQCRGPRVFQSHGRLLASVRGQRESECGRRHGGALAAVRSPYG